MKFSTRTDTDLAPLRLFQAITDFDRLEAILRHRGAALSRFGTFGTVGSGWNIGFDWRGRHRDLRLEIVGITPDEQVALRGQSDAFDLTIMQTVVALGREQARAFSEVEVTPRNMRARLLLQTAKLGKHQLDRQFERGVAKLIGDLTRKRA